MIISFVKEVLVQGSLGEHSFNLFVILHNCLWQTFLNKIKMFDIVPYPIQFQIQTTTVIFLQCWNCLDLLVQKKQSIAVSVLILKVRQSQ